MTGKPFQSIAASQPFQKIKMASNSTGLSQFFLRQGVKDGTIPHIRCGKKILINVPALLEQMDQQSRKEA